MNLSASPTLRLAWLLGMCAMLLIALAPFSSYVAALPFIQAEWGIGNTMAGLVFSGYLAGYAVSALLVLPLTDRLPTRWVFVVSATISVAGNALFPLAAYSVPAAIALRFAAGVGLVGIYMPGLRIISGAFPSRRRGVAMGLYVTSFYTANAVSLAATGLLLGGAPVVGVPEMDWRGAYFALSALSAVSVPMAFFLVRSAGGSTARQGTGRLDFGVLRNPLTRAYIAGYSLHAVELYAVRVWMPALLAAALVARGHDVASAAASAATVGGIALAAGSVGPVLGGAVSDKLGRARSAMAIFALSGLLSLAFGWMVAAPWPAIVAVACALGWAISADSSIYTTAATETAPPGALGSTMALQAFLGFMGGVAGPVVIGAALDVVPDALRWGVGFSAVALLSIAAIATLYPIRRHAHPGAPSTDNDSKGQP